MPRGGYQPGGGRKLGSKNVKTLEQEAYRLRFREEVFKQFGPLIAGHLSEASGRYVMLIRDSNGDWVKATTDKQIDAALAAGSTAFRIVQQPPDGRLLQDLWNRSIGVPKQEHEVSGAGGGPVTIKHTHE